MQLCQDCIRLRYVTCVILILNIFVVVTDSGEVHGCYGESIDIKCPTGERINILGDFYGLSSSKSCFYSESDICVVPTYGHTSVTKQVCNGRTNCMFTVSEQRECVNEERKTTYQQIKYECISETLFHNVCAENEWSASKGYLSTPNYPMFYPMDMDCRCILASTSDAALTVKTLEFRLHYKTPCRDYITVSTDSGQEETICGSVHRIYRATRLEIRFRSQKNAFKGFLLSYQGFGESIVKAQCWPQTYTPDPEPEPDMMLDDESDVFDVFEPETVTKKVDTSDKEVKLMFTVHHEDHSQETEPVLVAGHWDPVDGEDIEELDEDEEDEEPVSYDDPGRRKYRPIESDLPPLDNRRRVPPADRRRYRSSSSSGGSSSEERTRVSERRTEVHSVLEPGSTSVRTEERYKHNQRRRKEHQRRGNPNSRTRTPLSDTSSSTEERESITERRTEHDNSGMHPGSKRVVQNRMQSYVKQKLVDNDEVEEYEEYQEEQIVYEEGTNPASNGTLESTTVTTDEVFSPMPPTRPPLHFVSGCFGELIHFQCGEGEIIRIVDDLYGTGEPGTCGYTAGDCVVHPEGQASIVKQLCSSKPRCRNLIVTRLFCGEKVTSYEQITYECVPITSNSNVCEKLIMTSPSGYLVTPNFPSPYDHNAQCSCELKGTTSEIFMSVSHIDLHTTSPCVDWLEVENAETRSHERLCGKNRGSFRGRRFFIHFRTDDKSARAGIWLFYTGTNRSTVDLACNVPMHRYITSAPSTSITFDINAPTTLPTTTHLIENTDLSSSLASTEHSVSSSSSVDFDVEVSTVGNLDNSTLAGIVSTLMSLFTVEQTTPPHLPMEGGITLSKNSTIPEYDDLMPVVSVRDSLATDDVVIIESDDDLPGTIVTNDIVNIEEDSNSTPHSIEPGDEIADDNGKNVAQLLETENNIRQLLENEQSRALHNNTIHMHATTNPSILIMSISPKTTSPHFNNSIHATSTSKPKIDPSLRTTESLPSDHPAAQHIAATVAAHVVTMVLNGDFSTISGDIEKFKLEIKAELEQQLGASVEITNVFEGSIGVDFHTDASIENIEALSGTQLHGLTVKEISPAPDASSSSSANLVVLYRYHYLCVILCLCIGYY